MDIHPGLEPFIPFLASLLAPTAAVVATLLLTRKIWRATYATTNRTQTARAAATGSAEAETDWQAVAALISQGRARFGHRQDEQFFDGLEQAAREAQRAGREGRTGRTASGAETNRSDETPSAILRQLGTYLACAEEAVGRRAHAAEAALAAIETAEARLEGLRTEGYRIDIATELAPAKNLLGQALEQAQQAPDACKSPTAGPRETDPSLETLLGLARQTAQETQTAWETQADRRALNAGMLAVTKRQLEDLAALVPNVNADLAALRLNGGPATASSEDRFQRGQRMLEQANHFYAQAVASNSWESQAFEDATIFQERAAFLAKMAERELTAPKRELTAYLQATFQCDALKRRADDLSKRLAQWARRPVPEGVAQRLAAEKAQLDAALKAAVAAAPKERAAAVTALKAAIEAGQAAIEAAKAALPDQPGWLRTPTLTIGRPLLPSSE